MPESFSIEVNEYRGLPVLQIASEELFKTATRTMNTWRENIRRGRGVGNHGSAYVNTGEAANDVTIFPQSQGELAYKVGGDVVQLAIAEYGRTPGAGMPPPEPIADWMREALGETDPEPFPIQRHIDEEGIEPFKPGLAAYREHAPELSRNVAERLDRELREQGI